METASIPSRGSPRRRRAFRVDCFYVFSPAGVLWCSELFSTRLSSPALTINHGGGGVFSASGIGTSEIHPGIRHSCPCVLTNLLVGPLVSGPGVLAHHRGFSSQDRLFEQNWQCPLGSRSILLLTTPCSPASGLSLSRPVQVPVWLIYGVEFRFQA